MHDLSGQYLCSFCGQPNEVPVDNGGATHQELVEDCSVCCRPNVLRLDLDLESGEVAVYATRES